MPKKKSKSKPTPELAKEEPKVAEAEKPSAKKLGSEIDEIFAGKKRKKVEEPTGKSAGEDKPKKMNKKIRAKNGFDGFGESGTKARKRTEDGLAVYTEEELGISTSNAGATPLCPFDCSCCF